MTALCLIDSKSLENKSEYNWRYLNWLWEQIGAAGDKMVDTAQRTTEKWGDTRRRAKFKTNKFKTNVQIAHRSRGVESRIRSKWRRVGLAGVVAFAAAHGAGDGTSSFDSDSVELHVDNCASRCLTNNIGDFVRPPTLVSGRVNGIGGNKVLVVAVGTIKWTFDDDSGKSHTFLIPGSLYVPSSPARLFSPQHWAQCQADHKPMKDGTWQATLSDHVFLNWGQRKYMKRIPYNKANVATFWTTAGCRAYRAYKTTFEERVPDAEQEPTAFNTTVVTDDEADEWERNEGQQWPPDFDDEHERSRHRKANERDDDDSESGMPRLFTREDDDSDSDDDDDDIEDVTPEPTKRRAKPKGSEAPLFEPHRVEDPEGEEAPASPSAMPTSFDMYKGCEVIGDEGEIDDELARQKLTPRAELMGYHYRLGHLPFRRLQEMAKKGIIPRRLSDCRIPKCSACIYGKMTRRPKRTKSPFRKIGSRAITAPGQCVSVDQMESNTPGFIAQLKGIPTTDRYRGATIFVDHFSRVSFVYLQRRLTSEETVNAKKAFERYCEARGVTVKHYHCDNGRFADNLFIKHASSNNQGITYCGVNAHWQNGISEKRIRDLQELTTTNLLHAESKWPAVITANLWPYALRCSNEAMNSTPRMKDGKIPNQLFSGTEAPTVLRHFHPFGCPTYVLNSKLQAGQSIPKWYKRARLGVYLGRSPRHANSVALVLNLKTGLVSPAFHVAFDDHFETLADHTDYPNEWKSQAHFGKFKVTKQRRKKVMSEDSREVWNLFNKKGNRLRKERHDIQDREDGRLTGEDDFPEEEASQEPTAEEPEAEPPPAEEGADEAPRWSKRHKPTQRLTESGLFGSFFRAVREAPVEVETVDEEDYHGEVEYEIQQAMKDPIAFAASSDPDIMYLNQAMKQPDKKQFMKAMKSEIDSHTENKHWVIVPRSAVPDGMEVLPTVWAMRRKRRIVSREIYKWKARLNVHGGKQTKGVNYWETYAAALKWASIRFFLIQAILNNWYTRQVDFVLAYPQADVECDMYVEIPKGFSFKGSRKTHCLKLLKNVYGQRQGGRVWQQFLFKGLEELGWEQSQTDECVFYKGRTVFMVYTDDGVFCGPDKGEIDEAIREMGTRFNMTDEGTIDEYLGVKVTHLPDGTISLTQPHLIDSIIKDMGFKENTKGKPTPAPSTVILQRDEEGEPHDEVWEMRSIIGKLNFLEKSTRPDLAYSVHQCARFCSNPKASHSAAVRHIVRYLIETRDKGIILKPNDHSFVCYADADFAGNFHKETAHFNSMTAKSRGCYIIMYAGCPVTWTSRLINEVCLSSTESEYSILSEAAREITGLIGLMKEVKEKMCKDTVEIPIVRCTVFEDNEGAIALARLPKLRPRTKHICTKMHWFRSLVGKTLFIESIDTLDQLADIGTKPLAEDLFKKLRKRIMGW